MTEDGSSRSSCLPPALVDAISESANVGAMMMVRLWPEGREWMEVPSRPAAPPKSSEELRACWRCRVRINAKDAKPRHLVCETCRVALYCTEKCRADDALAHLDLCRFFESAVNE